jgi:PIN domain nuclease of toxin-antitoxin system
MKLLLDTHIWVWSVADESRLSDAVRRALDDPAHERWVSAISMWEVLILAERGRLILEPDARSWVRRALADAPVREAPVTIDVALASRAVRLANQDPADRFIAASAKVFGLTLVTADRNLCACPDIAVLPNTG